MHASKKVRLPFKGDAKLFECQHTRTYLILCLIAAQTSSVVSMHPVSSNQHNKKQVRVATFDPVESGDSSDSQPVYSAQLADNITAERKLSNASFIVTLLQLSLCLLSIHSAAG
jgi:hypothetical protein